MITGLFQIAFFTVITSISIILVSCTGRPVLTVNPGKAFLDDKIAITLSNCAPFSVHSISLYTRWADLHFQSSAEFRAGADGVIDPSRDKPLYGTYAGTDLMGLFWSMRPSDSNDRVPPCVDRSSNYYQVFIFAEGPNGETAASNTFEYYPISAAADAENVRSNGLVFTLFTPKTPGRYPLVLSLHGSGGGKYDRNGYNNMGYYSAFLARHGFAVMSVSYFGVDPLPRKLEEVPLEYFRRCIDWARNRDDILADKIGVVGISRGGELALLLGSVYTDVAAVVSIVGSSTIHIGYPSAKAAWTLRGKPLWYVDRLKNPLDAIIKVEKIRGGVLLITGNDDRRWDGWQDLSYERLLKYKHPFYHEHLKFDRAGHLIYMPYAMTYNTCQWGGTPEGMAHANEVSWVKTLAVLSNCLYRRP